MCVRRWCDAINTADADFPNALTWVDGQPRFLHCQGTNVHRTRGSRGKSPGRRWA